MTESHFQRLLIIGTDTNVGKTHVTCLIARQLRTAGVRVAAYKPVCSGAIPPNEAVEGPHHDRWDDIERIKAVIGDGWADETICPQRFLLPVAPPVAARAEGRAVSFDLLIEGANRFTDIDCLLIEGAGGWLSPITETRSVADLAVALQAPVLIVARAVLGTINHTLMAVESIRSRGLFVAGIVLNSSVVGADDLSRETNAAEIEARSGVPVLGTVPYGNSSELFHGGMPVRINWLVLAGAKSPTTESPCPASLRESTRATVGSLENVGSIESVANFPDQVTPIGVGFTGIATSSESASRDDSASNEFTSFGRSQIMPATVEVGLKSAGESETFESFRTDWNRSYRPAASSLPTLLVLVGSYASLLTIFVLYWFVLRRENPLESLPDLKTIPQQGGRAIVPRPENALPWGHELKLGESHRFGDVSVCPIRVTRGPLRVVHTSRINNGAHVDDGGDLASPSVLKLWVKFGNLSSKHSITPLDPTLMYFRRKVEGRVASYNVLFPSEGRASDFDHFYYHFDRLPSGKAWHFFGQTVSETIEPGETLETFVPAEDRLEKLSGDWVWRIHFRKGYGPRSGNGVTTLIDVRFRATDVQPEAT